MLCRNPNMEDSIMTHVTLTRYVTYTHRITQDTEQQIINFEKSIWDVNYATLRNGWKYRATQNSLLPTFQLKNIDIEWQIECNCLIEVDAFHL